MERAIKLRQTDELCLSAGVRRRSPGNDAVWESPEAFAWFSNFPRGAIWAERFVTGISEGGLPAIVA